MAELLAEREREPHGRDAGRDVVGVDVDDRHVEALGQVRGPRGRARVVGIGGEADLVVLDDVDRAADRVAVERLQVERLGDDTLTRERGVAVEDDRDRARWCRDGRAGPGAWSARRGWRRRRPGATNSRWLGLDSQAHDDRLAARQLVGALGAVVVLDVAGAALRDRRDRLERRGALELGEDRVVRAAEVVGEHVEAAAVGHPDHDLARAARRRQLDQLVEHRHGHVEALDRELLLAEVGLVHEALERVDLGQPLAAAPSAPRSPSGVRNVPDLDRLAQPQALAVRARCARSRRRSARSRSRAGAAARRRASAPGTYIAQDPGRDPRHQLGGEPERLPGRAPGRPRARGRAGRAWRRGGRACGAP